MAEKDKAKPKAKAEKAPELEVNKKTGLCPVVLQLGHSGLNAGDVAGFDPRTAADLVASKVATPWVDRTVKK
jgi:hypothetical protein